MSSCDDISNVLTQKIREKMDNGLVETRFDSALKTHTAQQEAFESLKKKIARVCKHHAISGFSVDIDAEAFSLNGHRTIVNYTTPHLKMEKLTSFISDLGCEIQPFLDDFHVLNPYLVIQKDGSNISIELKV